MKTKRFFTLFSVAALLILVTAVTTYAQSSSAIKPKVSDLTVTGTTTTEGSLNAKGGITNSAGPVSINAASGMTVKKDLDLQGTLKNSTGNPVAISGMLDVQGNIKNSKGALTIDDQVALLKGLEVTGATTLIDPGNLFVTGTADMQGDMNVDGTTTFNGDTIAETMNVNGILTTNGELHVKGGINNPAGSLVINGHLAVDKIGDWQTEMSSYTVVPVGEANMNSAFCDSGYQLISCDTEVVGVSPFKDMSDEMYNAKYNTEWYDWQLFIARSKLGSTCTSRVNNTSPSNFYDKIKFRTVAICFDPNGGAFAGGSTP